MSEQTASTSDSKPNYKQTINRPQTAFPMKANLVQNEPASQKRWEAMGLYARLREKAATSGGGGTSGGFVFHDGPPYANGSIHLGHLLNKVLKDFVVRTKTMAGYDVPYVPGWDCHGLPIEHKVLSEQRERETGTPQMVPGAVPGDVPGAVPGGNTFSGGPKGTVPADVMKIRRKCKAYAEKFVKLQSSQMQRLLTLADYEKPYLTMDPAYEAGVMEVFATMVKAGVVYRGLKPVHWSIENQTALAEAELEYYDREDTSVYVKFDRAPGSDGKGAVMIWTTTPWTLPANLAVAVHPRYDYGVYNVNGTPTILAVELAAKVLASEGIEAGQPSEIIKGEDLVGLEYQHPFIDRIGKIVAADYVTLEDGTGLVHTAPGHGVEDYQTGLREGLDIYCPVQHDGTFDDTAPNWLQGKLVWEANDLVVEKLRASGHLFHASKFMHSYPHDWRGKTPVIFRATEQWFVDVDKAFAGPNGGDTQSLRNRAIDAAEKEITFYPAWGKNRLRGMLESRPDWCLSRQRSWGLPIPAFYTPDGGVLLTEQSVRAVAAFVRGKGSDAWFLASPADILAAYEPEKDPNAPEALKQSGLSRSALLNTLTKGNDTFDVWFESGSSWHACMRQRGLAREDGAVTDLYLEGSDQHRGWFQHSLLPALVVTGQPAFGSVLTHGFMVDKDGKKMSKSLGNTLEVDELLKNHGADVCRWWVSSLNTDNDIKVDESYFKLAGEEYRKVRNTLRYLLSNLYDFDFAKDRVRFEDADAASIDAWATHELIKLSDTVTEAYDGYQFRKAHEALFNYCNDTLSAIYLAAVKDRLYCDAPGSRRRRRTQTTLYRIATTLIRLLAPLLPHTADEAWRALAPGNGNADDCVHLLPFQDVDCMREVPVDPHWTKVLAQRDSWLRALEQFRQANSIDNPLDLGLEVGGPFKELPSDDLADLCGISRFACVDGEAVTVRDLRDQPRCERSWKRDGTVKPRSDGGLLSDRDAAALGLA